MVTQRLPPIATMIMFGMKISCLSIVINCFDVDWIHFLQVFQWLWLWWLIPVEMNPIMMKLWCKVAFCVKWVWQHKTTEDRFERTFFWHTSKDIIFFHISKARSLRDNAAVADTPLSQNGILTSESLTLAILAVHCLQTPKHSFPQDQPVLSSRSGLCGMLGHFDIVAILWVLAILEHLLVSRHLSPCGFVGCRCFLDGLGWEYGRD